MKVALLAAALLFAIAAYIPAVGGDCVMYDFCDRGDKGNGYPFYNYCEDSSPARPLTDRKAIRTLEDICPHLFTSDDHSSVDTCCNAAHVAQMKNDLQQIIGFFGRCPQCLYNFYRMICDTACDPHQSDYTEIVRTEPAPDGVRRSVKEVNYYFSDDYAYGMYNACQNVFFTSAGQTVVRTMCENAKFSKDECGATEFYQASGDYVRVDQVPFQMNYCFTNSNTSGNCDFSKAVDIYDPIAFECYNNINVPYWSAEAPCSCTDCVETCPKKETVDEEEVEEQCTFLGFECVFGWCILIAAGCFLLFLIICIALSILESKRKKSRELKGSKPKEAGCRQKLAYQVDKFLRGIFYKWGAFCADSPVLILIIGLLVCLILILGIVLIYRPPITDPVELWASPSSRTKLEKDYFDQHFGPFYRTTQIIIRPLDYSFYETHYIGECYYFDEETIFFFQEDDPTKYINVTGIYRQAFLDAAFKLQLDIQQLTTKYNDETVHLKDVCFKPLAPDFDECAITSVFNYFQNDYKKFKEICPDTGLVEQSTIYYNKLKTCLGLPTGIDCLGDYGGPVFPWVALGGYGGNNKYDEATTIIITIVLNNEIKKDEYDTSNAGAAKAWEKELIAFLHNYTAHMSIDFRDPAAFTMSYLTERSIEDEIERQSNADKITIVISYGVMFAYIAIALGQYRPCSHVLINIKPTLGIAGVLIVTFSVTSSIGIFNFIGVRMTLIILEVVPFLVLAVGVDNIFIVVQTYQREKFPKDMPIKERIAEVVSEIGPSMLLTSISEAVAFFLGALTDMPAVRIFSLYAGMAVLMNFLLQISCFVCLLTLDARRTADNRLDVLCCIKCSCVDQKPKQKKGIIYMIFKKLISPLFFNKFVRPLIIPLFVAVGVLAAGLVPQVGLGLDQKLSMPLDSYVLRYLEDLEAYLEVGPPSYFVVKDNYTYLQRNQYGNVTLAQNAICGTSGCDPNSLVNQLTIASQSQASSYIATSPMAWLDEYYDWYKSCCNLYINNMTYCPLTVAKYSDANDLDWCDTCPRLLVSRNRIPDDFFHVLVESFLSENPSEACPKAGKASYAASVQRVPYNQTANQVSATNFMTYHTVLRTSVDFTNALRSAYSIADEISKSTAPYGATVFPYSIVYVFYEQYLTIVANTCFNVGVSIAAVLVISFILLGFDLWASLILVIVILFVVVDMVGCMYLWEIELNAVSLVNLVMCVGITVEFCAHIIRHFVLSELEGRLERARNSLELMGSSVFSGITLTKLGGIIVLGFSTSRLFQVFYFRMFLLMVVLGAAHGIIFLPVLLSYFGPPSNPMFRDKPRTHRKKEKQEKQEKQEANGHIQMQTYPGSTYYHPTGPVPPANAIASVYAAPPPPSGQYQPAKIN